MYGALRARVVRMHLSGRFRRIVRYKEEYPLEVVQVHLEEFDELVKLDQLVGRWFGDLPLFCQRRDNHALSLA